MRSIVPQIQGDVLGMKKFSGGTVWFVVTAFMRSCGCPDKSGHYEPCRIYHSLDRLRVAFRAAAGYPEMSVAMYARVQGNVALVVALDPAEDFHARIFVCLPPKPSRDTQPLRLRTPRARRSP